MIDLILRANSKATLNQWAQTHGLREQYVMTPAVLDDEGNIVTPEVLAWRDKKGIEYSWWAGSGRFMTQAGTYDENGDEITPPTYDTGVVLLLRLHHEFFENDRLAPDEADPEAKEQWAKSKIARYIKNNGVAGSIAGITYYEMDSVRLFRPEDVQSFLDSRGLPGHAFL